MFDWHDFLTAIGLVFVIEGMVYGLFPRQAHAMMARAQELPIGQLRLFGVIAVFFGLAIVWFMRNS